MNRYDKIKAIPTNGFRSRLEARWSLFFSALDMSWEYEPTVVDLGWCKYVPDFWVPITDREGAGYWVEIKPEDTATTAEMSKMRSLAEQTGHVTKLIMGVPWNWSMITWHPNYLDRPIYNDREGSDVFALGVQVGCNWDFERARIAAKSEKFDGSYATV